MHLILFRQFSQCFTLHNFLKTIFIFKGNQLKITKKYPPDDPCGRVIRVELPISRSECLHCYLYYNKNYGLRHTHASVLLYRTVDINYVSKRLGHSTIETTYKHYSHELKELREEEEKKTIETFENM